jgi:hypothetical protein
MAGEVGGDYATSGHVLTAIPVVAVLVAALHASAADAAPDAASQ